MQKERETSTPENHLIIGGHSNSVLQCKGWWLGYSDWKYLLFRNTLEGEATQLDIPEQSPLGCVIRLNPFLKEKFTYQESKECQYFTMLLFTQIRQRHIWSEVVFQRWVIMTEEQQTQGHSLSCTFSKTQNSSKYFFGTYEKHSPQQKTNKCQNFVSLPFYTPIPQKQKNFQVYLKLQQILSILLKIFRGVP